ncbi:MAG: hypothetical protein ACLQC7_08200 [Thermoplasmata archaeon]
MSDSQLRTLSNALGGSRELAVFEAFALREDAALSIPDISDYSDVAWATVHRMIRDWVAKGILTPVGKRRKATLYRLNLQSPTIQLLARTSQLAVREMLDSDLLDEGFPEYALSPTALSGLRVHEGTHAEIRYPTEDLVMSNITPAITRQGIAVTSVQLPIGGMTT